MTVADEQLLASFERKILRIIWAGHHGKDSQKGQSMGYNLWSKCQPKQKRELVLFTRKLKLRALLNQVLELTISNKVSY
uniref:Uncharacterized protein n=1 Tax=Megaselia scalaris TaxID=36166 RepID=T1GZU3_MEGSC